MVLVKIYVHFLYILLYYELLYTIFQQNISSLCPVFLHFRERKFL